MRWMVVLAVLLLAPPALAENAPLPVSPSAEPNLAGPLDATGTALAARTDAIAREAELLVADYRGALAARLQKLTGESPMLRSLAEAHLFTVERLLEALPQDPLAALPEIRKAYEGLDATAQAYAKEHAAIGQRSAARSAYEFLRKLVSAETSYRENVSRTMTYAPTLGELAISHLLDLKGLNSSQNDVVIEGYRFKILEADVDTWSAEAFPEPGFGDLGFFVSQEGAILAERGKHAGRSSPVYDPTAKR